MIFPNVSKREKRLFYLTIGLIFFSLLYSLVVKPLITNWQQLEKKIETSALKVEKNLRMLERKTIIQDEYNKYVSAVKMAGSVEEEMTKFLTEIESLASSSSVRIIGIKPHPVKEVGFYKKFFVELDAEGDINQISKFIYDMQNSTQLLKIDKLSIGTKGAGTNLLKCSILVSKILIPNPN